MWKNKNKNRENRKIQKYCENVLMSSINARTWVEKVNLCLSENTA